MSLKHFTSADKIQKIAFGLQELAEAFELTGNELAASRLYYAANQLLDIQKEIQDNTSKYIQERYQEAQQTSASLIKSCLAGAQLERLNMIIFKLEKLWDCEPGSTYIFVELEAMLKAMDSSFLPDELLLEALDLDKAEDGEPEVVFRSRIQPRRLSAFEIKGIKNLWRDKFNTHQLSLL